ncbi:MAG: flagellar hook-basal body complex protein, partial [Planctomycetota bacterium]|nr:flagellar hook-basal body complex protein [Planctomycetota bacterium]
MALSQALSTGITGLMTHQKSMDNIGNNLANVNTIGFKKGVYQFTTLLEQTLRGGMTADAQTGRGSVNPLSLGLGAQTGSINKVFTQGPIENTGNPNDMAIDGNGFFVLRQGNSLVYTRAGSFYRGDDGSLMASNGLFVQGTMAVKSAGGAIAIPQDAKMQNIVIPIGQTGGQSQTSEVSFMGNLDSRQEISTGTRLFGGTSYPTISSLQQWMEKDFNGGDPVSEPTVDTTWNVLEKQTFVVSRGTLDTYAPAGVTLPANVSVYDNLTVGSFPAPGPDTGTSLVSFSYVLDTDDRKVKYVGDASITPSLTVANGMANVAGLTDNPNLIPLIEEVNAINGGNVQTSAAYGIKVPSTLEYHGLDDGTPGALPQTTYAGDDGVTYNINNKYTFPQWFYESTGGNFALAASLSNEQYEGLGGAAPNTTDDVLKAIWPNGFNNSFERWTNVAGSITSLNSFFPHKDEVFPDSLSTPLGNLQYYKGNVWVQPFANIKNGDEITLSFKKGES